MSTLTVMDFFPDPQNNGEGSIFLPYFDTQELMRDFFFALGHLPKMLAKVKKFSVQGKHNKGTYINSPHEINVRKNGQKIRRK